MTLRVLCSARFSDIQKMLSIKNYNINGKKIESIKKASSDLLRNSNIHKILKSVRNCFILIPFCMPLFLLGNEYEEEDISFTSD